MEEVPKRSLRPRKEFTLIKDDSSDDCFSVEEEQQPQRQVINVLNPPVVSIHSRKFEGGKLFYFVRQQHCSFHQCRWVEEAELISVDSTIRNKLKRFDSTFLSDPSSSLEFHMINYDPQSYEVDRIVDCSEVFALIHPKKAGEMKNKWSESLLKVMRTLAAFKHNEVKYGAFYIDLSPLYTENQVVENPVDIATIINRLYLDYYASSAHFWNDVGHMFRCVDLVCKKLDPQSDLEELNFRMRLIASFLYDDWYKVSSSQKTSSEQFSSLWDQSYLYESVKDEIKSLLHQQEVAGLSIQNLIASIRTAFSKHEKAFRFKLDEADNFFDDIIASVNDLQSKVDNFSPEKLLAIGNVLALNFKKAPADNSADQDSNAQDVEVISDSHSQANGEIDEEKKGNADTMEIEADEDMLANNEQDTNNSSHKDNVIREMNVAFKAELDALFAKLKTRLIIFETLNHRKANPEFQKFFSSLSESKSWLDQADCQPEIISEWITPNDPRLKIQMSSSPMFRVKWCNMSYTELTWERECDIAAYENELKNYKRFMRAVDREARKSYLLKLQKFTELREIYENPKKLTKTPMSQISDLKRKIFVYKDPRNMIKYCAKTQPIFRDGRILRSYQLESLNWMIESWTRRRNVILADEMGLGKTIQAMAFVNHLISIEQAPGPYLIIAPLSTLGHWKRVFEDWTHLNAILYYDINGKPGRESCRDLEFFHWDITMKGMFIKNNKIPKFQVLITSFEVFIQDFESVFMDLPFQHIIIDEAHRLKNKNAKILTVLRRLVCKRILLLTGTPIQNNISELWSLLNFIEPNVFNDAEGFTSQFSDQMSMESLQKLKQLLEPYLLRRMKDEVESSIPPLTETIIDVELTAVQKIVYKTLYEKNKGTLQKGLGMNCISIMNNLEMQLRKCCNHPFLLNEMKQDLIKDCDSFDKYFDKLIVTSGKMIFLDKALQKFRKEGKKVLVFSQFTEMLKVIEEYLGFRNIKYQKIDGGTKAKDRQTSIDRFNNNQGFEVFLLSTKAGGLGINLTSASIVIIYDSDWNPQNDVQAIARAHRIGQTEAVKVFRLVSKKTYESEMFERASKKLGLDQAILLANNYNSKGNENKSNEEMTKLKPEEIEILLRKGMVGLLSGQDQEGNVQFAQDVDDIIQNARVANYSLVNGTYSFNKTQFLGNDKETLVQIDDPDFWKKVFMDQKSAADNLEREYDSWQKSEKQVSVDVQRAFFMKLSNEIYQYLEDRIKNEAFSADTEFKFGELLNSLLNDDKLHPALKEFVVQLNQDFTKKSRRVKRIDEKVVILAIKSYQGSKSNGQTNETGRRKGAQADKGVIDVNKSATKDSTKVKLKLKDEVKEAKLGKRDKPKKPQDDSEVFGETSEEDFKIKKKPKREEKTPQNCDICAGPDIDSLCKGPCNRPTHLACLQEVVRDYLLQKHKQQNDDSLHDIQTEVDTAAIESEVVKSFVNSVCYFCTLGVAECFECKQAGAIVTEPFKNLDSVREKDYGPGSVFKCSACPKFYHYKCVPSKIRGSKELFHCPHHFCTDCGEFSKKLYKCLHCTLCFHRRCMSKKNKIVDDKYIKCYKHAETSKKAKKPPVVEVKSYEKVLSNKKSSLVESLKGQPQKSQKKGAEAKKKVKENTDYYEQLKIDSPESFDYSNSKKVF